MIYTGTVMKVDASFCIEPVICAWRVCPSLSPSIYHTSQTCTILYSQISWMYQCSEPQFSYMRHWWLCETATHVWYIQSLRVVIGQKYTFPSFKPLIWQNLAYSGRSLNIFKWMVVNKSYDFGICQIHMAYFSRCYLSHLDAFHFDSHPILSQILPHCG